MLSPILYLFPRTYMQLRALQFSSKPENGHLNRLGTFSFGSITCCLYNLDVVHSAFALGISPSTGFASDAVASDPKRDPSSTRALPASPAVLRAVSF